MKIKPWHRRFLRGSIRLSGGGGGGGGSSPLAYFGDADNFSNLAISADQVFVTGFVLAYSLTFSNITIKVTVGDAVNNSDCGVYDQAGALLANIGPQALGFVARRTFPTVQGTQTIPAGIYLFGFTSAGGVLEVSGDNDAATWFVSLDVAPSVGGALPAAIGARSVVPSYSRLSFQLS